MLSQYEINKHMEHIMHLRGKIVSNLEQQQQLQIEENVLRRELKRLVNFIKDLKHESQ